ncbi:MAG: hypothetical protein R2845_03635 [Thermomicrobiales bacterium]
MHAASTVVLDQAVRRAIVDFVPALAFAQRFVAGDQRRIALGPSGRSANAAPRRLANSSLTVKALFIDRECEWFTTIGTVEFNIVQCNSLPARPFLPIPDLATLAGAL